MVSSALLLRRPTREGQKLKTNWKGRENLRINSSSRCEAEKHKRKNCRIWIFLSDFFFLLLRPYYRRARPMGRLWAPLLCEVWIRAVFPSFVFFLRDAVWGRECQRAMPLSVSMKCAITVARDVIGCRSVTRLQKKRSQRSSKDNFPVINSSNFQPVLVSVQCARIQHLRTLSLGTFQSNGEAT